MSAQSDVTVRQGAPVDDDAVLAGFVETYNGEPWNDAWTTETAAAYLAELRGAPRSSILVALIDDHIAGAALFHARTWQDASEIYIDELFVFPTAQRRGVGRALVAAIRDHAAESGFESLTLLTDRDVPAFDFYVGLGFREGTSQVFMIG